MNHTARQHHHARVARVAADAFTRGVFAMLADPNRTERAAGITTSPLDKPPAGPAVPAGGASEPRSPARCGDCGEPARPSRHGGYVIAHAPGCPSSPAQRRP